jgi:signal transduction histidine kinase
VQDEFGGAQVELAAGGSVAPGAAVDVAGFPEAGHMGGIVLRHALIRNSGTPAAVAPSTMVLTEETDLRENTFQLRRIRATVTGVEGDWLELDADGRLLRAARPVTGEALPKLPVGSVVDVTGVFVPIASSFPWVRAAERVSVQPAPQLLLRSAADVDVLSTPKWWAVRRTLLGGGGFVWIQILRRRVRQRSAELAETMKKLEEEVRMSATLAERDRLAGEIHDSVEQGLNGLVMQLDTAADLKNCPAEVRAELRLARNMAAFSRTEVKHAIWELQSPLLEDSDLPQAVQKVVTQLVPETLNAQINVVGEVRRLPSAVEHHLLRLAQEAVNNAVKHARAQNLMIELHFEPDAVVVVVQDDGCGFDPKNRQVERLGHFGLSSMRNRANKLLAELDIVSSPGQGTRVCVRVPSQPS